MIKRIKELLKNEGYATSLKSLRYTSDSCDVFKNPTMFDIAKIKKENPTEKEYFALRFMVDTANENVYVWDAGGALHLQVFDKLVKDGKNLNWDNMTGGVLRVRTPNGKLIADWDSMTFKNSERQIQKAGILLHHYIKHDLLEEFYDYVDADDSDSSDILPVEKNPNLYEVKKMLAKSEQKALRLCLEDDGNYYVWDAVVLHRDAMEQLGLVGFHFHLWYDPNLVFDWDDVPEEYVEATKEKYSDEVQNSTMVKNIISKLGITEIYFPSSSEEEKVDLTSD